MSEKEKKYATEICEICRKLPLEDQKHLIWIGRGILFASGTRNGSTK